MRHVENKDIARLLFASVTRPINAALAGAGTLFVVAGLQHPLSALGFIGAGMLISTFGLMGRDLNNKEFIEEVLAEGPALKALPDVPESLSGQYRMQCMDAKQQLDKTMEAIDSAGPDLAADLLPVRDQIIEQVESVYRLAAKAHNLDNSLTMSSRNEILKDTEKVRAQMVLTSDPVSRKHMERTLQQKEEQLGEYDALALRVRRIQAQMQYINATLENVHLKVMKISSADLKTGGSRADELTHSLQDLLEEVRLFERSLDATYPDEPTADPDSLQAWDARAGFAPELPDATPPRQALPGEHQSPSGSADN